MFGHAELLKFNNMKKFIIVLLLISNAIYAQHLGFNGSGFFENYNEDVVKWLHDMNQPKT